MGDYRRRDQLPLRFNLSSVYYFLLLFLSISIEQHFEQLFLEGYRFELRPTTLLFRLPKHEQNQLRVFVAIHMWSDQ